MFHYDCIYVLSNFPLELGLHGICAFLVGYDFDGGSRYLIHILNASRFISLVKLESELEDCFVFSVITMERHLLEYGINHFRVVSWSLLCRERHVLELYYPHRGSYDVVLGLYLCRVCMQLLEKLKGIR